MSIRLESAVMLVADMATARHFYEDVLEQHVALDLGVNVAYEGGFALWQRDHAHAIMQGKHAESAAVPPAPSGAVSDDHELYFETDDLDAVWERLSTAGVRVLHPLVEQPWGQRVCRVYDPDGHIVEVGEPMSAVVRRLLDQGLSVAEVAERAAMPIDIVRQIAELPGA